MRKQRKRENVRRLFCCKIIPRVMSYIYYIYINHCLSPSFISHFKGTARDGTQMIAIKNNNLFAQSIQIVFCIGRIAPSSHMNAGDEEEKKNTVTNVAWCLPFMPMRHSNICSLALQKSSH